MYYLKVAIITLLVTVGVAEVLIRTIGWPVASSPFQFAQDNKQNKTINKVVTAAPISRQGVVEVADSQQDNSAVALLLCQSAIKTVLLRPQYAQIAEIDGIKSEQHYQFNWNNKSKAVFSKDSADNDISLSVECLVDQESMTIDQLSIDAYQIIQTKEQYSNASEPQNITGKWALVRSPSQNKYFTNVQVSSDSIKEVISGQQLLRPTLIAACNEDITSLSIDLGMPFGAKSGTVSVAVDDNPAISVNWRVDESNSQLIAYPNKIISFSKTLLQGSNMSVRMIPAGKKPILFDFDLSGFRAALFPLQTACHWR